MIALLGATGYTGRLVAAELAARRLAHRVGGRSAERLSRLATTEGRETFVVDISDAARLDAFLDGADALITTVGPFGRLGWPALEAAVRNGVTYLDSSGEPAFVAAVYERFGDADVPVVPACGVEYVPGDLAVAIAMSDLGGDVHEVAVTYRTERALPSRGTLRTALDLIAAPGRVAPRRRRVAFPEGVRSALEIELGERVTVARRCPGMRVTTAAVVPGVVAGAAAAVLPRFARSPAMGRLSRVVVGAAPEGPPEVLRRRGRLHVLAEALGPRGRRAVMVECRDLYGLTGRILVEASRRLSGGGAMSPAQALDPVPFLDAISGQNRSAGFVWRRLDAG